jgi:hypothetical protein
MRWLNKPVPEERDETPVVKQGRSGKTETVRHSEFRSPSKRTILRNHILAGQPMTPLTGATKFTSGQA